MLEKTEPVSLEEGCLSVPDEWEQTRRFAKVRVRYQDRTGAEHELEAEGRLAHVLQHEIDHLEGTTFVDHLSQLKRALIRKRMQKLQKERAVEAAGGHVHSGRLRPRLRRAAAPLSLCRRARGAAVPLLAQRVWAAAPAPSMVGLPVDVRSPSASTPLLIRRPTAPARASLGPP